MGGSLAARRPFVESSRRFAHPREGVNQLGARPLAVSEKARHVAPVDAAAGEQEVVARAAGETAQLQLALRRVRVPSRPDAGEREADVTLRALARGEHGEPLRLASEGSYAVQPRVAFAFALFVQNVLDLSQGVRQLALRPFDAPLVERAVPLARLFLKPARGRADASEHEEQRRHRPEKGHARRPRQRAEAARAARGVAEEGGHAEGGGRGEVDDGEFAQTHDARAKGNAHASRARRGFKAPAKNYFRD